FVVAARAAMSPRLATLPRGKSFAVVIVLLAAALALLRIVPDQRLLTDNTQKRLEANDLGFNRMLNTIFETEPNAKVLSCWQVPYNIVGAAGHFLPSGDCSINLAQQWIDAPEIRYFLYWNEGNRPSQLSEIRSRLAEKNVRYSEMLLNARMSLFMKPMAN